ncbi:MAG: cytochrome c biogenesis protein ResB [Phycisphaerales bacterium]|nr:cytochrome c biogenesis protein ResB [Phycisphaerales bacterium]MCB9835711.1 cytochrome c biogenesis protein ResB [Phycisphaera sp.]
MAKDVLKAFASLKLTVVLLVLSMLLIFAGTLAQVESGVWTVVDQYFRSAIVRVDFQIFVPRSIARIPGAIILPGGALIGAMLFVNLVAAHVSRFKYRLKNAGIIVVHLGILLLIVGEFVTGIAAREGRMTILEGESSNYAEDIRSCELAVIDQSDSQDDFVVVVPQRLLSHDSATISNGLLPFEVRVDQWMGNSRIERVSQPDASMSTAFAQMFRAIPLPPANGVDGGTVDVPSAYITLIDSGHELGRYLVSVHVNQPQQVRVNGRRYLIQLRFARDYKPYRIELIDFRHDKFVGTETPRNFSSQIRLIDPERGVDRETIIKMNHPLRYAGETLYQASYKPDNSGTVLQVVRNPGWLIPYISCTMVAVGMLFHFGRRLSSRGVSRS